MVTKDKHNPTELLIKKFGGLREFARAIEINPSAIVRWRKTGIIPLSQWPAVIKAARLKGFKIKILDLYPF